VEHEYSPRGFVTITELLPGGRCFAFKGGNRTSHAVCCGYVRVSAGSAA
jgi:hypothetical protein